MKHAPAFWADTHFSLRARMLRTLHSEIRDVHRLATDVEYFFAKLNKLKQVFRARKSDIDYIGVCGNRTLHSESPLTSHVGR